MNDLLAIAPAEVLGHRIQQSLQVILAGLDERDALSGADMEALRRELRMLLQIERIQIATAEIDKAEQVLQYMLRPNIEECLNLWFGKSEQTDQEIWNRFGADVALASRGHYDHWALDVEHPRLLVALVIMLDQFPRNMYRDTPQMYACDARCLRPGEARAARRRERAPAPDRAGLPLPGADPLRGAGRPASVHGGVGPGDGRTGAGRPAERLPRDLPPARRGDQALRPVSPPQQDPAAGEHRGGGGLPGRTARSASTCR